MVKCNMDGPSRDRVMKLMQVKDILESEIREFNLILEANHVGMQDSLVDADGYPRNDIDIYKVREARYRIICLQNNHKSIMKQIEEGLAEVHSEFRGPHGEGSSTATPTQTYTNGFASSSNGGGEVKSFAVVEFVQEGSPADLAGLCENDELIQFGSLKEHNCRDITQVNSIVSHSIGQPIQVRVKKGIHVLILTVTPRLWAQPGLLGCQIRLL